jgi:hypothetical protein
MRWPMYAGQSRAESAVLARLAIDVWHGAIVAKRQRKLPTFNVRALLTAHRGLLLRTLAVLAWLGAIGGLATAWATYVPGLRQCASERNAARSRVFVRFLNPPKWVHGELEAQLVYTVQANVTPDPLDRTGLVAARESLAHTGWFEHVNQVRRVTSHLVTVDAEFANPYAVIRDREGDHLIDDHGRLLPLAFDAGEADGKFISIVGARFDRPAQAGQPWEGTDIAAAMRLLHTLYEQPWWQQVASIDVSSYMTDQSLTLVTDRGCLITWGRIPGEEMAAEVPSSRKLDYMQHHYARYGHIDRGFTTLDIRTDTVTTGDVLER